MLIEVLNYYSIYFLNINFSQIYLFKTTYLLIFDN